MTNLFSIFSQKAKFPVYPVTRERQGLPKGTKENLPWFLKSESIFLFFGTIFHIFEIAMMDPITITKEVNIPPTTRAIILNPRIKP